MPRKSRKSRKTSEQHAKKKLGTSLEGYEVGLTSKVFGNFHQGDMRFSPESKGKQCPCNCLAMLCTIEKTCNSLNSSHIDEMLIHGDTLYKSTAAKLEDCFELAVDGILTNDQLPTNFALGNSTYTVWYETVRYGRLDDNPNSERDPLTVELDTSFNITNKIIFNVDCYMMAIYKNPETNSFIFFDSHSRDESGFPTPDGTAVALFFKDLQHLHTYLSCLTKTLHLAERMFYIVPIAINEDTHTENDPGCSFFPTWTNDSSDHTQVQKETENTSSPNQISEPCPRLSRWQTWYQGLSEGKKSDLLAKKRKRAREDYTSIEIRDKKKQQAHEAYQNPEIAKQKKQQACVAYQKPEIAKRKKQQACVAYQDPEIAQRKKQQACVAYQKPEIAKRKKQQACEAYQDPEKAERKKKQAREHSYEAYQNPEKGRRKRTQARKRYADIDPQKKASKIQTNQIRRSKKPDIDTVVSRFQSFCKTGMQLIFECQICQRIYFRHQVKILRKENYNQHILIKSLPPDMSIEDINVVEDRDDRKTWICNTCHTSMKAKRMPKLATVNGLKVQEQPPELSHLNMLERHLIAPAIPFMKMISLIKGAQKGVHGQIVCVKADVTSVAASLPRLPTDHSLIRVKLKRKLQYKGHHMCQDVNPSKIRSALVWLKENNPEYEDIDINFDTFNTMLDDQLIHSDHSDDNEDGMSDSGDEYTQGDGDNSLHANHIQPTDDDTYVHDVFDNHINDESVNHADDNGITVDNVTDECGNDRSLGHAPDANEDEHADNEGQDNISSNEVNENEHDVTNTSAPLYSFLHAVDFAQYAADKSDSTILSVAPGEGNKPEHVLDMEPKCFPVEFPDGSNTYNESRKQKLSPSRYFNARLFSADNRFARNPEYIFFALYCTEVHQIHSKVSIATRIGCTKTSDGKTITASMLRDHEQVKELIKRDEGYRFLTQLRGTPAYWERAKKDMFAMIRQLGIPTFFVTFSAADRRWIEIHNSILKTLGKPPMTPEEHKNMSWDEHCNIIMSNPVAAAKLFQERLHKFINDVIMSPANPIGKVKDYFYRTEFQQRGWPHIHMVAWVENAPQMGKDPEDEVVTFVDRYISCAIPPDTDPELHEIVTTVQSHSKKPHKIVQENWENMPV
ncbi:uncharacterized protein [Amphiura filiformis]|uniref:uncharacterized protein isoform X2 n=1 Tax=Amphiura filiformis TaxID=82378 RepID=UPI003B21A1B0